MKTIKTEIFRDGQLLHTIEGDNSPNEAFGKLLRIQGNSTDYALRWGGYTVIETKEDGTTENWKPYSK